MNAAPSDKDATVRKSSKSSLRKSRLSAIRLGSQSKAKKITKNDLDMYRQELQIDDHIISLEALANRYLTSLTNGLTTQKASELLKINGPNALIPPKTKSRFIILMEYMFGGFSILLWAGAVLSFTGFTFSYISDPTSSFDQLYLATVLVVVASTTGIFGFYQESANTSIMDSFKKMIPKSANVIRNGENIQVPSENLVVGDVVRVQFGDCVPADIRIIQCTGLKVDNSSITGESDPQLRSPDNTDLNPLETANLAFYGTNVIEGMGQGMVISTGDNTLMGKIAGLTSGLQPEETPIKKELKKFINIITALSLGIGVAFFIVIMSMGYSFFISFVYFIAIAIANVPEGLLVTMTACLTLTARRMSKKNCMVKNLHAIETLGSTNVICSDKTGTLTQNRMTVSHMYYDGSIVDILSDKFAKLENSGLNILCRVGMLCNRAEFKVDQDDIPIQNRLVNGDASESAVLKCMEILMGPVSSTREKHPKVAEIPFNSSNKYQVSVHEMDDGSYLLVMKGAPERILDRCTSLFSNNSEQDMNEQSKKKLKTAMLELGYMGERVLGFSDLKLSKDKFPRGFRFDTDKINFPISGLRFVGLMSMIDPPRPGVPDAVAKCKTAGIRVIMVTGDHPITAMAIAKKVGIISDENETVYDIAMRRNISASKVSKEEQDRCCAAVITGTDLRDLEEEDLDNIVAKYKEIVFARTSPQQKLQIVEAFQRSKAVVAVTGDGVNDSPALKKADIGIAMGISGSDVSKEAADMIILDDNFASIVIGIEEGRLIFDNLKKSIAYMLTSNLPEIVPFMLYIMLGIPQPLSVMAILIIDVGTDLWPGISLAYEKAEADIMLRQPRDPNYDRLVNNRMICFTYLNIGVIQSCAGLTAYFFLYAQYGFLPGKLINIRADWEKVNHNDLEDSFGQEWSYNERIVLQKKGYAAYFLAIVMTQVADCFICKTRRLSIVHQGMTNMVMNMGLVFEGAVAAFVVYCPYVNTLFQFESIDLSCIIPSLPFAFMIVIFDETRRWLIRRNPGGWVDRETYI